MLDPDALIMLCAPTGRARRRMYEKTGYPAMTIQKAVGMTQCRLEGANSFLPVYQTGEICEIIGDIPAAVSCYQQCGSFAPAVERLKDLNQRNN